MVGELAREVKNLRLPENPSGYRLQSAAGACSGAYNLRHTQLNPTTNAWCAEAFCAEGVFIDPRLAQTPVYWKIQLYVMSRNRNRNRNGIRNRHEAGYGREDARGLHW